MSTLSTRTLGLLLAAATAAAVNLPSNVSTAYDAFPTTAFYMNIEPWSDASLAVAKNGTDKATVFGDPATVPGLLDVQLNFDMRPPCTIVGPL